MHKKPFSVLQVFFDKAKEPIGECVLARFTTIGKAREHLVIVMETGSEVGEKVGTAMSAQLSSLMVLGAAGEVVHAMETQKFRAREWIAFGLDGPPADPMDDEEDDDSHGESIRVSDHVHVTTSTPIMTHVCIGGANRVVEIQSLAEAKAFFTASKEGDTPEETSKAIADAIRTLRTASQRSVDPDYVKHQAEYVMPS